MAPNRQTTETDEARGAMQVLAEELDNAIEEERGIFPRMKINGRLVEVAGVILSPSDITIYGADGSEHSFLYDRDYAIFLTALVQATVPDRR